ncbi:MAG: type II secretion system secretin GspD [Alcanivoracaceae bacterium]|jgi:general secretion pathway protein D|nr:type II secretion system secretin GspD [Alcanivoracaceae bacterium]
MTIKAMTKRIGVLVLMASLSSPLWSETVAQPAADGKTWTVNIRNADLQAFITQVAEMTGKSFVVDPRVRSRDVTVISRQALSAEEVYELFLSVLQVHGYAAVPAGDVIKIVNNTTAKQSNLPLTQSRNIKGEELITRVIPVLNSPVDELVPVLRPLVPQYGHLASVSSANALIISDHADNIVRMEAILALLDNADSQEVEMIPLEHAWAADLIKVLENLIPERGGKRKDQPSSVTLVADERTNRLIVKGDREARDRVRSLVMEMDVPQDQGSGVQVIRLANADAKTTAELLKSFVDGAAPAGGTDKPAAAGGQVSIQADESLNALVIRAEPALMNELRNVIAQLDVRRAQILIEAAIVEVGGDNGLNLGFQWAAGDPETGVGGVNFSNFGISLNDVIGSAIAGQPSSSLGDGVTIGGGELDSDGNLRWGGFLQALASSKAVNLLSTPSITTLDNQEASIIVGQNVPFVTGQSTSASAGVTNPFTTIQREDVGITLKVTPHLAGPNSVRLVLEQEVSAVEGSVTGVNAADIITSKRSINTTVLADNMETVVLGGLIRDDNEKTVRKVPILGSIPVLGVLFRSTSTQRTKRNLMVFLRPTIISDRGDNVSIARQRYLGITTLQFRVDDDGELKKTTRDPLPADVDQLFEGRRPVPDEMKHWLGNRHPSTNPSAPEGEAELHTE